jgi:uncharacterized protein YbcI
MVACMQSGVQTGAAPKLAEPAARPHDRMALLCGEIAALYRRVWGRGPVKSTAQWAGAHTLVVLLETGHTESEMTLRAAGHAEQVIAGRRALQSVIEAELKSTVERIVGRRVETVLSAVRLDPDLSAEIFILAPGGVRDPAADRERTVFSRAGRAAARAFELS